MDQPQKPTLPLVHPVRSATANFDGEVIPLPRCLNGLSGADESPFGFLAGYLIDLLQKLIKTIKSILSKSLVHLWLKILASALLQEV
jgi:hypothetical protein